MSIERWAGSTKSRVETDERRVQIVLNLMSLIENVYIPFDA